MKEHPPFPKDHESTFEGLAKEIADRNRGAAVFLMICGGVFSLFPLMFSLVGLFGPKQPDEVPPWVVWAISGVPGLSAVVILVGGVNMRRLKNYGLCRVAVVLASVNWLGLLALLWFSFFMAGNDAVALSSILKGSGPFLLVLLPMLIRCITLLRRADVKAAFAANDRRSR